MSALATINAKSEAARQEIADKASEFLENGGVIKMCDTSDSANKVVKLCDLSISGKTESTGKKPPTDPKSIRFLD